MDQLPLDVLEKMSMELSGKDLLKFCQTDARTRRLCDNPQFWERRFQKDYPDIYKWFHKNDHGGIYDSTYKDISYQYPETNWRQKYLYMIGRTSKMAEDARDYIMISLGDSKRFLKESYPEYLLELFQRNAMEPIQHYLKQSEQPYQTVTSYWDQYFSPDHKSFFSDKIVLNSGWATIMGWEEDLVDILENYAEDVLKELGYN